MTPDSELARVMDAFLRSEAENNRAVKEFRSRELDPEFKAVLALIPKPIHPSPEDATP